MSSPLRLGICGLGFMGQRYFGHLRQHAGAQVVAVCDRDERRRSGDWSEAVGNLNVSAGKQADLSGVRAYAEASELAADSEVDAIAITLPTNLHADLVVQALEAGKHVACEKPMALTVADCDRMIAAAEQAGRTLMIAQCIRFWPQYEEILRRVQRGDIGRVQFAALRRVASAPGYSSGGWLMDARQSGGALFDLHVHDVDFAQYLLGMPIAVSAFGRVGPSGGIDHVVASYSFADGCYAQIEGGWIFHAPWPFDMAITVVGEDATLDWSMQRGPEVLVYRGGKEAERVSVSDETGWTRELDYFVERVAEGHTVDRCLPTSARDSIVLVTREQDSIARGGELLSVG